MIQNVRPPSVDVKKNFFSLLLFTFLLVATAVTQTMMLDAKFLIMHNDTKLAYSSLTTGAILLHIYFHYENPKPFSSW